MKTNKRKNGYSYNTAREYVDSKQAIYCLSLDLEPQVKFENNQPTDEVIAYKAWFSQQGLIPFVVKFDNPVVLPGYMSIVKFENLEACEVGFNVYFRAEGLTEVK